MDANKKPYLLHCYEWMQNQNGTVEKIELRPDPRGTVGAGQVLLRASDSPWGRENPRPDPARPNKVTNCP